ncbi:MAG TPA: hypothetical protein VFN45_14120 [Myxococcaceae bacterium]|nr:hypothetical protein [Myxococcaceae bacterium]
MPRLALAAVVLLGSVAAAQPVTYFVPIAGRTSPALSGTGAVDVALWYSDPGTDAGSSLLFATSNDNPVPFVLATFSGTTVTGFPLTAAGVATTPDVLVQGTRRSLVAVAISGAVSLGVIENGQFVARSTNQPINGGPPLALAPAPGGGAILLVSDSTATQLTRYDLDLSGATVTVAQGLTAALLTEPMRSMVLDGARDKVLVGGNTLGNLYILNAGLDAGPVIFDVQQLSAGRLIPPVTGVAVYQGSAAAYLLVTSAAGLTIYDLLQANPLPGAFRVIAQDQLGPLTGPTGVAVTNLAAGSTFPEGVIALGDATNRGLALVRWDAIPPDAGLIIDPTTDPRGLPTDGGPDAGCDGGGCGPSGGPPKPGDVPPGPDVPVPDSSSSCASAPGGVGALAMLVGLLAVLGLRRGQRR